MFTSHSFASIRVAVFILLQEEVVVPHPIDPSLHSIVLGMLSGHDGMSQVTAIAETNKQTKD